MLFNQQKHRSHASRPQNQHCEVRHDDIEAWEQPKRYEGIDRDDIERRRYEESKQHRQNEEDAQLMDDLYDMLKFKKDAERGRR